MKYSDTTIPTTKSSWLDAMAFTVAHANNGGVFPTWSGLDFNGAFYRLHLGLENQRRKLGDIIVIQLFEMLQQSKEHYEAGYASGGPANEDGLHNIKLGSWLLFDIVEILQDRPPYAYPEVLYRWLRPSVN